MAESPTNIKILVIQLTRFGDILMSIPTLNALRRKYPRATIDLMVRQRFQDASAFSDCVDTVIPWNTRKILGPFLTDIERGLPETLAQLGEMLNFVRSQGYTHVFNISFSPVSSFLTYAFSKHQTVIETSGYTRHSDGFLAIPDEVSAYFHAQIQVDATNRIHVCDALAAVCGVSLESSDWQIPVKGTGMRKGIVVHCGASQKSKTLSPQKWFSVLGALLKSGLGPITLIGSQDEAPTADDLEERLAHPEILNKVGKTSFQELAQIIADCQVLVGGDSSPIHLATLTQTKVLNISLPDVRFWETGPRSAGSRILCLQDEADVGSDQLAQEVEWMLSGTMSTLCQWIVPEENFDLGYVSTRDDLETDYAWALTQAIYFSAKFPKYSSHKTEQALLQLLELCTIALENTPFAADPQKSAIPHVLERIDETITAVMTYVPEVRPLVRWYLTEKVRQGPMQIGPLINDTLQILRHFNELIVAALSANDIQAEAPHGVEANT